MAQPLNHDDDDRGVAEVLDRFRAGARQRQAELACLDEDLGRLPESIAALRRQMSLAEPSFRREGGSALVHFCQKAIYHLFSRRHHRSLLEQQSRFNRSVTLALEDLHRRRRRIDEAHAATPSEDVDPGDEGHG